MRILMISDVYFPRINGVSTSIQTYRRELLARGHEVVLIAPAYDDYWEDDADVLRIPARQVFMDPEDRLMRSGFVHDLTGALYSRNFDIVHIQTPFLAHYLGVRLAKRLGIPRVETYHTFFEEYLYHYIPFLPRQLLRYAARRLTCSQCNDVDAVVVPSTAMLEVLRGYGVRSQTEVIPTGLETDRFVPGDGATFRRKHGIADDRPTLVHIGRIAFEKNIDFLLHVLVIIRNTVPDVILVIAGEGPALSQLRALVERLGLADNVHFVGYLARDGELLDCYRAGDVFVFASRTETQGLVLLEAMAQGTPVVSTAVMGTKDVLRDGVGALIATEDADAFAAKVLHVLRDPLYRAQLAATAPEYAHSWSATRLSERMTAFYAETIARHLEIGVHVTEAG